MQPGKSPRLRAGLRATVAAAALGALAATLACAAFLAGAPAPARAAIAPPGDGALSPRLAELAKPAVRSAPSAEQAKALSLAAEGPGSLLREGNRVLVEVRFDHGAAAATEDLRQAGAEVVNVSRRYQTVTVAAKPDELRALNGVPLVAAAKEVLAPITYASTCPSGAVVSEGVQQLHAGASEYEVAGGELKEEARKAFGVDGGGVTVGILSDSFNEATEAIGGGPIATHEEQDIEHSDLPGERNPCGYTTDVNVLDDTASEGEDEGRAMAQIVHDVAPGANLAFATAFTSETAFAENIERLAKPPGEGGAGAKVIADDVSYFDEPFFQEGPVGAAIDKVTEEDGVSYFSAAGNNNLPGETASWEAPSFRDSEECPSSVVALSTEYEEFEEQLKKEHPGLELPGVGLNASHCMDFNPSESETDTTFGIRVSNGRTLTVDLQWAEPWFGVNSDLDAFLLNSEGEVIAESTEDNVSTSKRPYELISWENKIGEAANVQLVINRYSGGDPRLKFALLENGGGVTSTEYETSSGGDVVGPTIFGHNGGEETISVGAMAYSTTSLPETYSSHGPVTHYFGPVNSTTPASRLETPQGLSKPDLTATDCGRTTFFTPRSTPGLFRFCGTSAATPHAAAVAALMLQRDPSATPSQIRSALTDSAQPIGEYGPDAVGAGLVDAVGALERVPDTEGGEGEAPPEPEAEAESATGSPEPASETPEPGLVQGPPDESEEAAESPSEPAGTTATRKSATPAAPSAFFRHTPTRIRLTARGTARVVFLFGSDRAGVTFLCKVDRERLFHRCPARFVRLYRLGRHVVRVKARNAEGAVDATPAVYRFRVKRVHRGLRRRRGG